MNRHGLRSVLQSWHRARARQACCVLATVISTRGSSYRKAGARMLIEIDPDHSRKTGIVGGGCFDDDLMDHARRVASDGQPMVCRYDMTSDDDVLWGLGMGCNGAVDVFLQPVGDSADETLGLLDQLVERGGLVATAIVDGEGRSAGSSWIVTTQDHSAHNSVQAGLSGDGTVFVDRIEPPFWLGIFGAGSDVLPVLELADQLDWRVAIWDHRPGYARADRFEQAAEVEAFTDRAPAAADRCNAILVMSHNFDADRRFLAAISDLELDYLGVLGPGQRRDRLLEQLGAAGDKLRQRLLGPVGLDLGGELPEDIALSAIAQIQARRHARGASALNARPQPQPAAGASGR